MERHAVVGQHALDGNSQAFEVRHGGSHERLCAVPALVGVHLREGDATVVVHGDEHVLPPDVASAPGAIARDAVAHLVEAPELLDVDVQQLAWALALVALHKLLGPQIAQARQPSATQNPADGCLGHAHVRGDTGLQHELAPQLHDGQRHDLMHLGHLR